MRLTAFDLTSARRCDVQSIPGAMAQVQPRTQSPRLRAQKRPRETPVSRVRTSPCLSCGLLARPLDSHP
jgi:hypothetical protein